MSDLVIACFYGSMVGFALCVLAAVSVAGYFAWAFGAACCQACRRQAASAVFLRTLRKRP